MDASSDWRFKTHLANLPIYYEYKADGISSTDAIKGTYLDNYKQICITTDGYKIGERGFVNYILLADDMLPAESK